MTAREAPSVQARWPRGDGETTGDTVVAGYDGSPSSVEALTWAAAAAGARGARLRVLCVADLGEEADAAALDHDNHRTVQRLFQIEHEAAEKLADEGVRHATQIEGGPLDRSVEPVTVLGDPIAALVEASRGAGLLVVGHRDFDELAGALLESVAHAVTTAAVCPVVVVRAHAATPPDPTRPVVVGVDGSESTGQALAFASDVAARTGAPLVVLAAWTPSEVVDGGETAERARQAAQTVVEAAVEHVRSTHLDVTVTARVVEGHPATALVSASGDVGLVVVGVRRDQRDQHRSDTSHGSVSHATIHRASCPVAVVHATPAQTPRAAL